MSCTAYGKCIRENKGHYGTLHSVEDSKGQVTAVKVVLPASRGYQPDELWELHHLHVHRHPHLLHALEVLPISSGIAVRVPWAKGDMSKATGSVIYVRGILQAVGAGLDHMHRGGSLHLDIKLANILYMGRKEGDPEGFDASRVVLGDFGLSRPVRDPNRPEQVNYAAYAMIHREPKNLLATIRREPQSLGAASEMWALGVAAANSLMHGKLIDGMDRASADAKAVYAYFSDHLEAKKLHQTLLDLHGDADPVLLRTVEQMLDWNPETRLTFPQLLQQLEYKASVEVPPPAPVLTETLPRILRNIAGLSDLFGIYPVESIFTAINLYRRSRPHLRTVSTIALGGACLYLGTKLHQERLATTGHSMTDIIASLVMIEVEALLSLEREVVKVCGYIVHQRNLYHLCRSHDEVRRAFTALCGPEAVNPVRWQETQPTPEASAPHPDSMTLGQL